MGFLKNKKEQDDKSASGYHSASYHAFFEGYSEERVPKSSGHGTKILRTYTGVYSEAALSKTQWVLLKVSAALFYVLSAAFLALYSVFRISTVPVVLRATEALGFIALFVLLYFLILYLTAPKKMTAGDYHILAERFPLPCFITGGVIALHAVIYGISLFFLPSEGFLSTVGALLFALLSAVLAVLPGIRERRLVYQKTQSELQAGPDSVEL